MSSSTMATAGVEEKKNGNNQIKKEKQSKADEVVAIESDVATNSALPIQEPAEEAAKLAIAS